MLHFQKILWKKTLRFKNSIITCLLIIEKISIREFPDELYFWLCLQKQIIEGASIIYKEDYNENMLFTSSLTLSA